MGNYDFAQAVRGRAQCSRQPATRVVTSMKNSPAMTTHDFHNEGALMRICSTDDGVDALDDSVQGRVGADRHVRAAKIIVDRADHTDDVQVLVLLALLGSDRT
jgi:hypothetical protein